MTVVGAFPEAGGERRVRVAIVGAGFSGLSVAWRLRERGEEDFVVLERGESVGGVWRDNTYPGAACDVPSHLYSLSFAPNPEWDRSFSSGAQIRGYLEGVVEKGGLAPWVGLGEELLDALWDDDADAWRIKTTKGRLSADVLVACAGPLTEPIYPEVTGLESFRGKMLHSSRWDHGHDLSGERVAVVGTGASAVQIVPELQRRAGKLVVFQRTPGWVVPRPEREVSEREKRLLRRVPALVKLYRLKQFLVRDGLNYRMIRRNPLVRRLFERASRSFLEEQVRDPALREKLMPDYEIGCKRVLITNDFYPALAETNVELVSSALSEVREGSVVAADGTEHAVDAIVFATGFETTTPPIFSRIRGRGGLSLNEVWGGRPRFHRATAISGFPNFFNICSAGTGSGHGSMIWKAESQTSYVLDALRLMREEALASVEVRADAQDRYMEWVGEDLDRTVWARGGCQSWYLDDGKKPSLMWPRTMLGFRRMLRRFDPEHYHLRRPRRARSTPQQQAIRS
ncbi:MAG: Cyclohexanone monooxygenase [uncultured Rubrobacteraceae bacterium]|uniref:Cyclohexanone monooxygenase n=1 Tax=uncultured Rubrobacteraceae bacterium TaxID=349277 RepID=A0A6J4R752_9ACTN|nr:MAG: Cyclohexanone monooxygenase [uncultured Rubrobacteraceae bacterium]